MCLETPRREGEPFTANVDCPQCGCVAVHWLDEPRLRPDVETPQQGALRRINESIWLVAETIRLAPDSGGPVPAGPPCWYDPEGTVVARVCVSCGHRWGQR